MKRKRHQRIYGNGKAIIKVMNHESRLAKEKKCFQRAERLVENRVRSLNKKEDLIWSKCRITGNGTESCED